MTHASPSMAVRIVSGGSTGDVRRSPHRCPIGQLLRLTWITAVLVKPVAAFAGYGK